MECSYWAISNSSIIRCGLSSSLPATATFRWRWRGTRKRLLSFRTVRCQKMFVPGFGEASPEAKAAGSLQNFFTYVAVKIVLAQLQSYNPEAYGELMEFISRNSLNDGDSFCRRLMRESPRHKGLALRILEVRSAYTKRDFEWENLQKLAFKFSEHAKSNGVTSTASPDPHLAGGGSLGKLNQILFPTILPLQFPPLPALFGMPTWKEAIA